MERKGFNKIAVGATAGMLLAGVLVAPPTAGAQTSAWTMPTLRGELLQDAVDAVTEAAGAENVTFNLVDQQYNQVIYNYTNWVVCVQNPPAESEVKINPGKPRRVSMGLKRPTTGC